MRFLREIVGPMRQKAQEEEIAARQLQLQQENASNTSPTQRPASSPAVVTCTSAAVDTPLDGVVLAQIKHHWMSSQTPIEDRGNPFAQASVDLAKLAELFNAAKSRAGKFLCAAADMASLETFIAKYISQRRRSGSRKEQAQEITKTVLTDLRVVRSVLQKMRQE
ncbi:hypothetical protein RvY_18394-3 [Ramazzottius varieornatus]|uniref:Uncharacterized protein n=1 Tax=Ramazzottius varieornatus TaxID=947166 RepID=A0A1D1W5J8_RAMVA|nr:hypothetical protein RvY_18394-3 [Ramazzottius varieornatus]